MENKKTNENQIDKRWYRLGLFLGGIMGTPVVIKDGVLSIKEELKRKKERKKVHEGLLILREHILDMATSSKYTNEQVSDMFEWYSKAVVEYYRLF